MPYTGDVTPGGPPDVRELAALTVTKVSVGPMDNNAYLLRCRATGELLLIDAANEAPRLLALLGDTVLTTVSPRTGTGTIGSRCRTSSPRRAPGPWHTRRMPKSCRWSARR